MNEGEGESNTTLFLEDSGVQIHLDVDLLALPKLQTSSTTHGTTFPAEGFLKELESKCIPLADDDYWKFPRRPQDSSHDRALLEMLDQEEVAEPLEPTEDPWDFPWLQ